MTLTQTKILSIQVAVCRAKVRNLDASVMFIEERIEMLEAEAVVDEIRLEQAYEYFFEVTGKRAIEESKFLRVNDELGLLRCKEALPMYDDGGVQND